MADGGVPSAQWLPLRIAWATEAKSAECIGMVE